MLVSNASTLVLLAKIDCLEQFVEIFPPIEIPQQVRKEALFHADSYYSRLIKKLIDDGKIKVVLVNKTRVNNILQEFNFDEGEAATYVLYNAKKHKAILTDDGELIKLCKLEKIDFICAMAVLIRMYEKRILSKNQTIKKLEDLHSIGRYSAKIYEHFKKEVK